MAVATRETRMALQSIQRLPPLIRDITNKKFRQEVFLRSYDDADWRVDISHSSNTRKQLTATVDLATWKCAESSR